MLQCEIVVQLILNKNQPRLLQLGVTQSTVEPVYVSLNPFLAPFFLGPDWYESERITSTPSEIRFRRIAGGQDVVGK